jgi:hypothetical protein
VETDPHPSHARALPLLTEISCGNLSSVTDMSKPSGLLLLEILALRWIRWRPCGRSEEGIP